MTTASAHFVEPVGRASHEGAGAVARRSLREALSTPELRAALQSLVRRRVPAQDAEDVLQAVLCDALASTCIPPDSAELPRWVMGIARHKVADFHRRAARESCTGAVEARAAFEPVEERDLLERVVAEERGVARETLHWVVREWSGEPLHVIAEEAALPAEVVRQRVSRLRRRLRAKWLLPLLGVLLCASGGAYRWAARSSAEPVASRLDPSIANALPRQLPERSASAPAPTSTLEGAWRVAEIVDMESKKPEVRAWARAQATLATIVVHGDVVTISSPAGDRSRTLTITERRDRVWIGRLVDPAGNVSPVEIDLGVDEVVVKLTGGPLPGTARLVR